MPAFRLGSPDKQFQPGVIGLADLWRSLFRYSYGEEYHDSALIVLHHRRAEGSIVSSAGSFADGNHAYEVCKEPLGSLELITGILLRVPSSFGVKSHSVHRMVRHSDQLHL